MKLTNEQNFAFMNDPRRVAAQQELDSITHHIQSAVKSDGSAMYYMTTLPTLLKKLSDAYEKLSTVEAIVTAEIIGK